MDFMDLNYSGGEATITLHIEDELRREPLQSWDTDEDQQIRYPGDRFFSDLPNIAGTRAMWGQSSTSYGAGGRGVNRPPIRLP